jgi:AAA15 family ATPase/GTPase
MLTKVRIQNYKSIRDVTVDLQQVNLLIGANNSGKTNFLNALEFFGRFLLDIKFSRPNNEEFIRLFFNQEETNRPLAITFWNDRLIYKLEIYEAGESGEISFSEFIGQMVFGKEINYTFQNDEIDFICDNFYSFYLNENKTQNHNWPPFYNEEFKELIYTASDSFLFYKHNKETKLITENLGHSISLLSMLSKFQTERFSISSDIINSFSEIQVFKPDPNKLTDFFPIKGDDKIAGDCSNLVSYLDRLRDTNPKVFAQIQEDLKKCVPEFDGIRFDTMFVGDKGTSKRIGLANTKNVTFWADELSEGTLYFLCLLCIIHQPNPPKLLLLEELEKGIHPVRIQEVVNFIFRLAEEKDIQIIMTSHHPLVLEEFKDIPESVFIFDKTSEGSTVKNLLHDVIEVEDKKREEQGLPRTDYVSSLSDHWTVGLIGGVPK